MRTSTLGRLIGDLSSPDISKRRAAAQALGEADERAIYPLIKALKDQNPGVQDAAMHSLINIGGEVLAYMVIPLLRDDSYLRNTALLILKELGAVCAELLYPLLKDKDEDVRKFTLDLMADIREGLIPERIMPLIEDTNANVRAAAIRAIGALRYRAGAGPVVKALKDEEWVCFSALETLGELKDEGAVDAITELLSSGSETLRVAALETLGKIGSPRARDAVVSLVSRVDGFEKTAAVKSLVQIGIPPSMGELSGFLMDMFRDSDWEGKLIALRGLHALKVRGAVRMVIDVAGSLDPSVPGDDEKLMSVIESLKGFSCSEELAGILSDPSIRYRGKVIAAEVVGATGCEEAVPALIELYDKHTRDVRRACVRALGRIANEEARRTILRAVSDYDSHIRKEAASALGEMGGRDAFELLLGQLEKEEFSDVMEEAVKALLRIDDRALFSRLEEFPSRVREAIGRFAKDLEMLKRLSADRDLQVRVAAISGLGNLGGASALEAVLEVARDPEPELKRTAAIALGGMEFQPEDIRPLLSDTDMWVRLHAVRALGQNTRPGMLELIRPMLEDPEVPVVLAAVEAAAMIGDEEAAELLSSVSEHQDEAVRASARGMLERL